MEGKKKEQFTRKQFESLILGKWETVGRRRKNNRFWTWVDKPWKYVSDSRSTIRAKSWLELAKILHLR